MTEERPREAGWTGIDDDPAPQEFVAYLDAVSAHEGVRAYKRDTFAQLRPRQGARLLDVGCGTGDDVLALARLVGPAGRVVGVDASATMVAEARRRAEGSGAPVEFVVGDAHALDLPDASFDGARSDRILMHLDDPARAVAELARVTRPGGRVVLSEPDWETLVIDAPDRLLTRRLLNSFCDGFRHGWIGRRLPGLLRGAGLVEIVAQGRAATFSDFRVFERLFDLRQAVASAEDAGIVSAAEAAGWLAHLEEADRAGRFFGALTGLLASGQKP